METERGRGSFALTPPPDGPTAAAGTGPWPPLEDRLHLLEFRIGVESEAAALAARNRTDRQLNAVRKALEDFTDSVEHPAHAMKADLRVPPSHRRSLRKPLLLRLPRIPGPDHDRDAPHPADDRRRALCAGPLRAGGPRARIHLRRHRGRRRPSSSAAMRSHLANSRRRLRAGRVVRAAGHAPPGRADQVPPGEPGRSGRPNQLQKPQRPRGWLFLRSMPAPGPPGSAPARRAVRRSHGIPRPWGESHGRGGNKRHSQPRLDEGQESAGTWLAYWVMLACAPALANSRSTRSWK